jgi:hypothetical protein
MEPREYGELGLRSAVTRLGYAVGERGEGDVLVALAETLYWAGTLDDLHSKESIDLMTYYRVRDADPDGAVLAGLIYARNLTTHSLAAVSELVVSPWPHVTQAGLAGRPGGRIHAPPIREDFRWKSFAELPLSPPEHPEKHARDEKYRRHIEGRNLLDPIGEATRFLVDRP